MKKLILLVCLTFGIGLNAEVVEQEKVKATVQYPDVTENGKNEMKRQAYAEDGSLESFVIARTNLARGTYTEYYKNGGLKLFRVVN